MKIQSTASDVKAVEVKNQTVYIRKNIVRVERQEEENVFSGWEYDETQMPLEDYLQAVEGMGQQLTALMLEVL